MKWQGQEASSTWHPSLPLEEIGKLTKVWQRCQVARNSINKKINPTFCRAFSTADVAEEFQSWRWTTSFIRGNKHVHFKLVGQMAGRLGIVGRQFPPSHFFFVDWCVWLNMPYIISEHADEKKLQRTAIEPGKRRKLSCLVTFPLVPRWCYYPFNPGERKKRGCPGRRGRLCLYTASLID